MDKSKEKVFETSTIRLSADETRAVIRAVNKGKNNSWVCSNLVDLGVMRKTPAKPLGDIAKVREGCWQRISKAVAKRDIRALSASLQSLQALDRNKDDYIYVLTDLGKQIARGITVRMNGQYS